MAHLIREKPQPTCDARGVSQRGVPPRSDRISEGAAPIPGGVPLYTDARHYSEAGVPTVPYGAGPRTLEEASGHRADERLQLDDLYRATEVVALSLADMLRSS